MEKTTIYDIVEEIAQRNGIGIWEELPKNKCIKLLLEGIASIIDNE